MDAQSVKTVEEPAHISGFDGHKRVKGLVDFWPGSNTRVPRLKTVWQTKLTRGLELAKWCQAQGGWELEVVRHAPGAHVSSKQEKRWIVEHTIGWLCRNRRMSKDYARKVQTSETLTLGSHDSSAGGAPGTTGRRICQTDGHFMTVGVRYLAPLSQDE